MENPDGANHAATRSADRGRTAAVATAFDEIVMAQVRRRRGDGERCAGGAQPPSCSSVRVDGELLSDFDIVSILRNWTAGDLGSMAAALGVVVLFFSDAPRGARCSSRTARQCGLLPE